MKKRIVCIFIVITLLFNINIVEASPLCIKNVKVSVVYADKNSIKLKVKNNRKNNIYPSQVFILQKKVKGKWKKIKFKKNVKFAKTIVVPAGEKRIIKIKWKKFFDKKLKKGKYRIKFLGTKKFTIPYAE